MSLRRRLDLLGIAVAIPLAAAALGGCSLTRPPAQVASAAPAQWNNPLPATLPHDGSLSALADWWRTPGDPLLVELIEAAERESASIAAASARIAEARATRVAAGAALLPNLDASLSGQRGNSSFGSSPTGATGSASGGAAASSAGSSSIASAAIPITTISAGLQSRWEIDLFGGLSASRDQASAQLAGSQARWHDARVSVAAETANAYFGERACAQQLAVATSDAASRTETSRLTDLSTQAGFTAPADNALARASAADASSRLTQQRAQCAVQRTALVALTGLDARALDQKLDADTAAHAQQPLQQRTLPAVRSVASVPADMLVQRPDVYAAELAVAAASADVGANDAQRYPKLSLSGSIARVNFRVAGISESLNTWTVGPVALTLPIFDGGTRTANLEAARARYDEAAAQYRGSVRQAVREVEQALIQLQATDARGADADIAVQNFQASFNAVQARYQSGLASLFELEDQRRQLFAAQTARVGLQQERAQAWVSLYRSMGGGWTRQTTTAAASAATTTSSQQ